MELLIPPIGASGLYVLSDPFASQLKTNVSYTCIAIRKISDFLVAGIDVFEDLYKPNQILEGKYSTDLNNGACIVSLQATDGTVVHVPNTYIQSYPQVSGVPYNGIALMVFLGALPDAINLSYVKTKLTGDITSLLGVSPTVTEVVTTTKTLISQDEHLKAETARQSKITNSQTDYSTNLALQQQNAALLQKVAELESYIVSIKN